MAISPNYQTMRAAFAPGASLAPDGMELWQEADIGANGFGGAITSPSFLTHGLTGGWPITLTCNAGAQDAVAGVDDYDWYVSQRTDVSADQYLVVSSTDASGTITIDFDPTNTAKLLPGIATPTDDNSIALLLKHVDVYAHRRTDDATDFVRLTSKLLPDLT